MNDFQLNRIKAMQENSFMDEISIDKYTETKNSCGEIIKTWTSGSVRYSAGFKSNMASKSYGETEVRLKYSGIFRISTSASITELDKITLTKISGSTVVHPKQYQVSTVEKGHGILIIGAEEVGV